MDQEDKTVAEMIRKGTYFTEALAWYQTIYLNVISERAFFLLMGILAALTGLFAVIALTDLMPIISHAPIVISAKDVDSQIPSISHLREPKEPLDTALPRFYVLSYITSRESYHPANFDPAKAFVAAHSDPSVLPTYLSAMDATNPQSLPAQLSTGGERNVTLQNYKLIPPPASKDANATTESPMATVLFTTTDTVNGQSANSNWRATVTFYYTPLTVKEVVDKQSGQTIIQTEDPQFQVVKYDREKLP